MWAVEISWYHFATSYVNLRGCLWYYSSYLTMEVRVAFECFKITIMRRRIIIVIIMSYAAYPVWTGANETVG